MNERFRTISWGRGVPSTTMAVMSALGHLPHVDAVLHCNPGWEHSGTYDIGDWYSTWLKKHGIYTEVIPTGDIREDGAKEHLHIPFWTATGGPLRRQCTRHFKIDPQKRRLRELLGYEPSTAPAPPSGSIEQWIGFTIEEWHRMKDSRAQYIVNRWPLIEMRMTRQDCIDYLTEHGLLLPPPSSCVGCPYKSASRWLQTTPDEFAQAVEFDEANRHNPLANTGNVTSPELYIWKEQNQPIPLAQANFRASAERERLARPGFQLPLMCGAGACMI